MTWKAKWTPEERERRAKVANQLVDAGFAAKEVVRAVGMTRHDFDELCPVYSYRQRVQLELRMAIGEEMLSLGYNHVDVGRQLGVTSAWSRLRIGKKIPPKRVAA